jgi:hypothetical protein
MEPQNKTSKSFKILFALMVVIAISALGSTALLWQKLQNLEPAVATDKLEMNSLVKEIGQFLDLPQDETPTLLTISTLEGLENQPFFKNAMIGDKVLVYEKNTKAVLWRPSTHKVIEASIISISPRTN